MRVVSIDHVQPGMEIGRTIYGAGGEVLLAAGVTLNAKFIDRLRQIGISAVYIQDDMAKDIEIDDVISDRTRLEARQVTQK